jgi:branched-chain amino acid transport system ATP-binding protein
MLEVNGLSVAYGAIEAVKDVTFTVAEGQIVCLVGANGAGKSTTLKTVSGLLRPRRGEILFLGEPIHRLHLRTLPRPWSAAHTAGGAVLRR